MIKLACMGQWKIIDLSIKSKIKETILDLLAYDNYFQFYTLFKGSIGNGQFTDCCNSIIFEMKKTHPEITLELNYVSAVADKNENVICPLDIDSINKSYAIQEYRLGQWMIDQSDYLIWYAYDVLNQYQLKKLYNYAIKKTNIKIVNLTNEMTTKKIQEKVYEILDEREKYIFLQRSGGIKTITTLSKEIGVSCTRIRYIHNRAIIKIMNNIRKDLSIIVEK